MISHSDTTRVCMTVNSVRYMAKSVLGRGMGALLDIEEVTTSGSSSFSEIRIELIHPNPNQPRTHFDEDALDELAISIKAIGIIQPITVRKTENDSYEIISGERRYRASKKAGLTKIPAYIKTAEDELVMKMALVENIQREDLNSIEIALGYQRLIDEHKLTQEKMSELVGKKRATVTNYLRLLKLPAEIQLGIIAQKIDMGHARALVGIDNPTEQLKIYNQILENNYTVRMVEDLARSTDKRKSKTKTTPAKSLREEHEQLKQSLSSRFNTKVDFSYNGKGKGKIVIPFASDEELEKLIQILNEKE